MVFVKKHIDNMLRKYGLEECKPISTPFDISQKYSLQMSPENEDNKKEMMKVPYRQCIGSLLFAAQISRPDICYAVNVLSRYCENPGRQHWQGVKRILRYLKGTKSMELVYKREAESKLMGFCDADWGGDIDERKSTTGYVFTYAGGAVTWSTKRQPTVALSTTEAEFMAMTAAVQEGTWLKQIMNELLPLFKKCITIHSDNKGALELAKNNQYSPRTKHIDIKHKFVNEKITKGEINFEYTSTEEMPADILTKRSSNVKIQKHIVKYGLNNEK